MVTRYKENSFSAENPLAESTNEIRKDNRGNGKVNIDDLLKKIVIEKRREKKKGLITLSVFLLGITSLVIVNF